MPTAATESEPAAGERFDLLLPAARIRRRVSELAHQIGHDHRGKPLTLIVVLKGAIVFAADLMRRLPIPFHIDFISASSYGAAVRSSGAVRLDGIARLDLAGRHVVIVEDIVDTGLTLSRLIDELRPLAPAAVEVCALVRKQVAGALQLDIRYLGFELPDHFVVGYGMDHAERYRHLAGVYRLVLPPK